MELAASADRLERDPEPGRREIAAFAAELDRRRMMCEVDVVSASLERSLISVVVGFDGSPAAVRGLERAASVVGASGALIIVAVEPEVYSRGLLSESQLEMSEFGPAELLRQARKLLPAERAGQVSFVRRGDPADELLDVAREHGAGLVVVARRGQDFAARVLVGSVAARIVANAPCDVLVVS